VPPGACGEAGPEGEAAAGGRKIAGHAHDRAGQVVRRRIVGAAVRIDGNVGVRLGNAIGDRRGAMLLCFGGRR